MMLHISFSYTEQSKHGCKIPFYIQLEKIMMNREFSLKKKRLFTNLKQYYLIRIYNLITLNFSYSNELQLPPLY